jgi:1-deoxy-D-xylulose 5-phosphate reductoisomerase
LVNSKKIITFAYMKEELKFTIKDMIAFAGQYTEYETINESDVINWMKDAAKEKAIAEFIKKYDEEHK